MICLGIRQFPLIGQPSFVFVCMRGTKDKREAAFGERRAWKGKLDCFCAGIGKIVGIRRLGFFGLGNMTVFY